MKKLFPFILFSLILHVMSFFLLNKINHRNIPSKPLLVKIIQLKEKDEVSNKKVISLPKPNNKKPKDSQHFSESDNSTSKETINKENTTNDDKPTGQNNLKELDNGKYKGINLFPQDAINYGASLGDGGDSQDIEGLEIGGQTTLNSKAYKYAYFFNRIRDTVVQFWKPIPEIDAGDPYRNKYFYKNRKTVLRVTLSAEGDIIDIYVSKSSEVDFLDDLALDSMKRCVQFPNPPKGLVKDGTIIFTFGFIVTKD